MSETSKAKRLREVIGDYSRFIKGFILDIGCGNDPVISPYGNTTPWEISNGDGQYLDGVNDKSYDCVYSSHSLEHMNDIAITISNWSRVLKDEGCLFIVVPDFDLYEKGVYPSRWNTDHKHTFSINKTREEVGRDNHWCVQEDLFKVFKANNLKVREIRLEDYNFDYRDFNKTEQPYVMYQITIICRKNMRV